MQNSKPAISFIIQCGLHAQNTSNFLNSLVLTQPLEKIELLFVCRDVQFFRELNIPGVQNVQFYFTNKEHEPEEALALAVKHSKAEYIFYVEDHILFENDVVSPILELFKNNIYSAISPTIQHANPQTKISRLAYIVEYSDWNAIREEGEINSFISAKNIAYKKSILIDLGKDLPLYLRNQTYLQMKLLKKGHKYYFTRQAIIKHIQSNNFGHSLTINFWHGWDTADAKRKIETWGITRRIFMAFAIQAKPLVRLFLNFKKNRIMAKRTHISVFGYLLGALLIYFAGSIGESCGYFLGRMHSTQKNVH